MWHRNSVHCECAFYFETLNWYSDVIYCPCRVCCCCASKIQIREMLVVQGTFLMPLLEQQVLNQQDKRLVIDIKKQCDQVIQTNISATKKTTAGQLFYTQNRCRFSFKLYLMDKSKLNLMAVLKVGIYPFKCVVLYKSLRDLVRYTRICISEVF